MIYIYGTDALNLTDYVPPEPYNSLFYLTTFRRLGEPQPEDRYPSKLRSGCGVVAGAERGRNNAGVKKLF